MAYIEVVEHEDANEELDAVYKKIIGKRGKLSEVLKIQSLNPEALMAHLELYMAIMFGKSPLKRYQREMVGVIVSCANNCEYCKTHHSKAVEHFWKDAAKAQLLCVDYTELDLNGLDRAMCDYAWNLTKHPATLDDNQYIKPLREMGLTDRAILDLTQVIAYFNFVNRMVLGLGVNLEEHQGAGFKYD
jgi:uncharacterized peroxidase-related enzyme